MGFFDKFKGKVTSALGFDKLKDGLSKTRSSFVDRIQGVLGIGRKIDESLLSDIEDILISSDIGVATTDQIISSIKYRVKKEGFENANEVYSMLKEELHKILPPSF